MSIPNYDPETGIHYGVISQNSIQPEVMSDIFDDATDLSYEYAKKEMIDKIVTALGGGQSEEALNEALEHALGELYYGSSSAEARECAIAEIVEQWTEVEHSTPPDEADREALWGFVEDRFNNRYDDSGERSWEISEDQKYPGYHLRDCLTSDVFVIKSPYFTWAPVCSPCVPNAGNLDSAAKVNEKYGPELQTGLKTYCLDESFFEGEKSPYPVFRVDGGQRVDSAKPVNRRRVW